MRRIPKKLVRDLAATYLSTTVQRTLATQLVKFGDLEILRFAEWADGHLAGGDAPCS